MASSVAVFQKTKSLGRIVRLPWMNRAIAKSQSASKRVRGASSQQNKSHCVVYSENFKLNPIPDGHRFPMPKDAALYHKLQSLGMAERTFYPGYPTKDTLSLVHDPRYVDAFMSGHLSSQEMRRIGLQWTPELVNRTLAGVGSAILAGRLALMYGVAVMTNGGTHHAHSNFGSGWCIFNDLAVSAKALQRDAGVGKVAIIDLDVHAGDGTAEMFAHDPTIFTYSIHCGAQSFPADPPSSDYDVPLEAGTGDEEYMKALRDSLPRVLESFQPDVVLYNAGVDVHKDDTLGLLALTDRGIEDRDRYVLQTCCDHGIPLAAAIGGGYCGSHGTIDQLVERHLILHCTAFELHAEFLNNCSVFKYSTV